MINYFYKNVINLTVIFSMILSCLLTTDPSLKYNTTSGLHVASLVKVYDNENSGAPNDNTYYVHKLVGIKYAEKPERFQQSVMKTYESGIHFNKEPVSCFQSVNISAYGLFNLNDAPKMTEDCLTINLFIPIPKWNLSAKFRNMSVIVHVHGGSNAVGSANLFDGSIMASHGNLIVAVINYRLSILGFLSDMTEKYPGNYGLRDQILAIKWIKMNCHIINCNPDSITLWGHSAGAGDVNWLALSPLSNKLFKRVIIQSGSAFAYWAFDKKPNERYKSMKDYFNCTNLPEYHSNENSAMTRLIDNCLIHVSLDDLFSFKFALIDAPGPTYDGFLGNESLINARTLEDMIDANNGIFDLDILTGINTVEGFSFEGYFSSSVKFWSQNNISDELVVTFERFSLLSRDRCVQNSYISNRFLIEKFYHDKLMNMLSHKKHINNEMTKRLKTIFANSHIIFDSGFVNFIKTLSDKKRKYKKDDNKNLYVYEYSHENSASILFLNSFKKNLNNSIPMSTHFDGIDLAFGLPIAYHLDKNKMSSDLDSYDFPFVNFYFDSPFNKEDSKLSKIFMGYLTNFAKTGNPNEGDDKIAYHWNSYLDNNSYVKINSNLINGNSSSFEHIGNDIRNDLYKMWFDDMDKDRKCSIKDYKSKHHTTGKWPEMDKCLEKLEESHEYMHLTEMFLFEYEKCMGPIENNHSLRNFFSTICLDAIAIRRLLIEYELCCDQKNPTLNSTICLFNNFDKKFLKYNLTMLINYTRKMTITDTSNQMNNFDFFFFNNPFYYLFFYFTINLFIIN